MLFHGEVTSSRNFHRSYDATSTVHCVKELLSTKSGCLEIKRRAGEGSRGGGISPTEWV